MPALTDLDALLAGMRPHLAPGEYVFVSLPGGQYGDRGELAPEGAFLEDEGLTLIVPCERAEVAGLAYNGVFRRITLRVHSSLAAVGLTAAVAARLAGHGIPANVVAAFHHDHVFVPAERAEEALAALAALSRDRRI